MSLFWELSYIGYLPVGFSCFMGMVVVLWGFINQKRSIIVYNVFEFPLFIRPMEEGLALVKKFDGEFPDRYFDEVMEYIGMEPSDFMDLCDKFRSPHLWDKNQAGEWKLRHNVWGGGLED